MATRATPAVLGFLAAGFVGRQVCVRYLNDDSGLAYTNGQEIFVPGALPPSHQQLAVMCQALILKLGTIKQPAIKRLLGKSRIIPRFILLELMRAEKHYEQILPKQLLDALAPYKGVIASTDAASSLKIALSLKPLPSNPPWFGTLKPIQLLFSSSGTLGKPLEERELSELEQKIETVKSRQDSESESQYKDPFWQLLSSPLGKDGLFSKALRDILDMSSSPEPDGQEGFANASSERVGGRQTTKLQDMVNAVRSSLLIDTVGADMTAFGDLHEWDFNKQAYKENWVTHEVVEPYCNEPIFQQRHSDPQAVRAFLKALIQLKLTLVKNKRSIQGDDINLDALIEHTVKRVCGDFEEPKVYKTNLRMGSEFDVQVLMDASSSTLECAEDDKLQAQHNIDLTWLLCESFSRIGSSVAAHAFHSWGRQLLKLQRLKTFKERSDTLIQDRIKQLSLAGYTRTGAAIRFGTNQLAERAGSEIKLLIIVSDGYPFDDDYEGRYALEDTKKALDEAKSNGVACVCLCVGSDVSAAKLDKVYGGSNYLSVDTVDKVPIQLARLISNALAQF